MTWAAVWGFVKRIPGWLWLGVLAIFAGGLYVRERRKRIAAEDRERRMQAVHDAAFEAHAEGMAVELQAAAEKGATDAAHAAAKARTDAEHAAATARVEEDRARTEAAGQAGGQALADEVGRVLAERRERLRAKYGEET